MKHVRTVLWLLGLVAYLVLFYATPLPGAGGNARRVAFLSYLLLPDALASDWFGTPPEFSLADRLPVLLIAGAILAYAWSLGWLLMALCGAGRRLGRLEGFVFSTAVGLNVVSTYVLAVGLLGWLDHRLVFAVPAGLTLALTLAVAVRRGWRRALESSTEGPPAAEPAPNAGRPADSLSARWLWLTVPFVLVILLGGMLPPVDFDVREYHLQVPKEFFQQGYIGFLPHNVYGNMAMGTEMLSLLAMVIAGDWWLGALAGKTVIAAMAPLTALALYAAGRRFFSTTAGVVAAVVYISTPWIVSVSTAGLVEGASAYYLLLAVYAVLVWTGADQGSPSVHRSARKGVVVPNDEDQNPTRPRRGGRDYPLLLLAGYLAGGAVSCKYPAVLFVVVPLAVWVFFSAAGWVERSKAYRKSCRAVGIFLLAAFVGCGLWFGKNLALTGNPTYPLLYGVFGGKTRTPEKNRQWNAVHRPKDFSPTTLARDLARVGLTSEWLNPVVVPLAVLAFLDRRRRRLAVALLAYFGFVIAAWWLLTHRIDRFWISTMPVLALLAGAGACWVERCRGRRLLVAVLLVGVAVNFPVAASGYNPYFVRLERLRRDPRWVDPWHLYFNTHVTEGRVLMVGEAQVFDLEVPVLYNTCFDDCLFERLVTRPGSKERRSPEEIRAALADQGVSYVYVDWGEIERYRRTYGFANYPEPDEFVTFVAKEIRRLAGPGGGLEPLPKIKGHPGRGYRVRAD